MPVDSINLSDAASSILLGAAGCFAFAAAVVFVVCRIVNRD